MVRVQVQVLKERIKFVKASGVPQIISTGNVFYKPRSITLKKERNLNIYFLNCNRQTRTDVRLS